MLPAPLVRNVRDFLAEPSIWELAHLAKVEADRVLAGRAQTLAAATTVAFAADISQYNGLLTAAYPWRGVIFRLGEGDYRKDAHFDANYAEARRQIEHDELDWFGVYHVGIKPGVNGVRSVTSQVDAINSWLGGPLHAAGALMQDAENWSGKQGGDLSAVFNGILEGCVPLVLAGNEARTLGYANGFDWANLWPTRPAWLKRTIASWGTTWPGSFGWQFRGGTATPVPAGYPTTVAPLGAVDLNAFLGRTHADVAAAFGIGAGMALTDDDISKVAHATFNLVSGDGLTTVQRVGDVVHDVAALVAADAGLIVHGDATHPNSQDAINAHVTALQTTLASLQAQVARITVGPVDVDALAAKLASSGLPLAIAQGVAAHIALTTK